jgi:hypothetical protein
MIGNYLKIAYASVVGLLKHNLVAYYVFKFFKKYGNSRPFQLLNGSVTFFKI